MLKEWYNEILSPLDTAHYDFGFLGFILKYQWEVLVSFNDVLVWDCPLYISHYTSEYPQTHVAYGADSVIS